MANWTVEVRDMNGDLIANLSGRALKRRIVKERNKEDVITLTYDIDDIEKLCNSINLPALNLFAVNINEIRVRRNDTIYSAGEIVEATPYIDGSSRRIDIVAHGWLALLKYRVVRSIEYEATDAGQIAWGLIDDSQNLTNGDFGFTQGIIEASLNRDRTYLDKNIYEAIQQLTEVINGIDVEVTAEKVFNVYYPKKGDRLENLILTYPGMIERLSFSRKGSYIANEVIARGYGTGPDTLTTTAEDTPSQTYYQLRQATIDLPDISREDTLQENADEEVQERRSFIDIPDITLNPKLAPVITSYDVGDEVFIQTNEVSNIFGVINDWFRVEVKDLSLNENNDEVVRLKFMR